MPNQNASEKKYRWLSFGLLLLCLGLGFGTIDDYGMGWDEATRWTSGDAKVAYYEALTRSDDPLEVIRSRKNDGYPGFFDITLSRLHAWTGWDRFILGHWQAFVFGIVGLAALWGIGVVFGGARLGFWSVLLMLLLPSFYGHWFHNPKDIPFAATYTLGLWAIIRFFAGYPSLSWRWVAVGAVACGLCMATRIAGMVLLAYLTAGTTLVLALQFWGEKGLKRGRQIVWSSWRWLAAVPLVGAGAYIVMLPWWPAAHKNLFSVSESTLRNLHVRASEIPLFFRGEFIWAADAPFYYTIWMFFIKSPEVLLIGLFAAFGIAAWSLVNWAKQAVRQAKPGKVSAGLVLLLGGLFPLLYLTATAPALHNGIRHFLFLYPPICVCAAWGYLRFNEWLRAERPMLVLPARVAFAVLLFLPAWNLYKLHPYQYIYFNTLAGGPSGAYGAYEGEYWFTSSKHAVEQLAERLRAEPDLVPGAGPIRIFILGPWQVAEPFLPEGYALTADPDAADFLILNTQMLAHVQFAGEELFRIERMGVPICLITRSGATTQPVEP